MAYLPQHADTGMLGMDMSAENNGVADFMFAGNIGKGQRADVIIKAAKVLGKRKDYRIHMLGDGRMREELEQMVRVGGECNLLRQPEARRYAEVLQDGGCAAGDAPW